VDTAAQMPIPFLAKGMVFSSHDVAAMEDYFKHELLSSNDV